MNGIHELYKQFGKIHPGDLSGNQKKEIYTILKNTPPQALTTLEDHKMYIEVLQKLRQSTMDEMQLMGKKFLATLESLLSVGEDGVYSNNQRFIYELIQNVDDCEYEDITDCNLEVRFCYDHEPAQIIFTYNEKGFTPENVFAITGIAEASKNISADKVEIGEKGIGFKSVFGIAEKVLIESGKFAFELHQNNFTVPIPRYDGFKPISGTRLTLEMESRVCREIYRSLVDQYMNKDAALNKNPILFLNKLTHLKMYFDNFRYIKFDVQRKEPVNRNGILVEDSVKVSIDMKDSNSGYDRACTSEISCYRYTMPVLYGKKECIARYGEDVAFHERKHNIIAVLPELSDELKGFTGVMYSFLPTQIQTTAPVILHVPFKLDGSREFVDPQGKNEWFSFTMEKLAEFLRNVYLDFSRIQKENIIAYIPPRLGYLFKRNNEKIACLLAPEIKGDIICREKLFLTTDGTYENAANIVSFPREEVPENPVLVHRLLGLSKKLFVPPYEVDMKWYNVQVVTNITGSLFAAGIHEKADFNEILTWFDKNKPEINYGKLIVANEPLTLTTSLLETISRHKILSNSFLQRAVDQIRNKQYPRFLFSDACKEEQGSLRQTIEELVDSVDLDYGYEKYLQSIHYKLLIIENAKEEFVLAGKNGIALSGKNTLNAFARLSMPFDPRKIFSATLQIREASERLNEVDENISNIDYLMLLRAVRISLKSAFGPKMYNSYIQIIRDAGADKGRFLSELIQNADDCAYTKTTNTPRFVLRKEEDRLYVSYNEDGFTKDNVRALTAIGESTKKLLFSNQKEVIGEKGVGFKSVFGVAHSVEIHSNGFDFKLTDNLPTVPEKCAVLPLEEGTSMIFQMKKDISSIFTVERILQLCVCLRNLKELLIFGHSIKITDRENTRTIEIDGIKYKYERFEYNFKVTDPTVLAERNLNGRKINPSQRILCYIPDRIKDQDMLLYSGLPTALEINVPLIIDAPFELITSRENILHNRWNQMVRDHMYQAILYVMEQKKNTGLEVLRYVGFRSSGGTITLQNFDDEFLNKFNWIEALKKRNILPVLGEGRSVSALGSSCILIPEFIAKLYKSVFVKKYFSGTVVDTLGKSQYVPLLEVIGCRKAKGSELLRCLESIVKDYITDEAFRVGLYAYLSNNQGNIAFEGVGEGVKRLPFIPIRSTFGTEYISYRDNIYKHKTEISKDDYYILNAEILPIDTADRILGRYGRINELTQEVFEAKYRNNLERYIQSSRPHQEKARYLLNEFEHNTVAFKKCEASLKGLVNIIPLEMSNKQFKTGNKFLNSTEQFFAGPLITQYVVSDRYAKLAKFLGCTNILDIHYDDFDMEIERIEDDDIEDLQCGFKNFYEIITRLMDEELLSEEQIDKYNLEFGSHDNGDDIFEAFPEQTVRDINSLRFHIKKAWEVAKNPYVEKQYIQWKPQQPLNKKNYAFSMYQSEHSEHHCFCQMCKKKVHKRYIERNDIEKTPAYAWNQMYLNLCLTCSKDYLDLRHNDIIWNNFISCIMRTNVTTSGRYDIPIGDKIISFTATHLAEVQEIFKAQGWPDRTPKRIPKLGKSVEDQTESEKRTEEKEVKKGQKRFNPKKKTFYHHKKK